MIFVWNNEPITLGRVEPLDRSRNLKDVNCGFLVASGMALNMWRFFRPHAAFPPLHLCAQSDTRPHSNHLGDTRPKHSIAAYRGQWKFPRSFAFSTVRPRLRRLSAAQPASG